MELPVVAMSLDDPPVAGLVLHAEPFQTPRLRPTIWVLVGCRLTMLALTAPRLAVVNECVNAPFLVSVPVKVSVNVSQPGTPVRNLAIRQATFIILSCQV